MPTIKYFEKLTIFVNIGENQVDRCHIGVLHAHLLELRRPRFGFCGLLSVPAEIFVSGGVRIMAENPLVSQIDDVANQDYLRKLAISLISSLGVDGAIHVCQANSWDGVLNWVMALGETGEARTGRA